MESRHPVVFYESVHRIIKTLKELGETFSSFAKASEDAPERKIVVCRELTKMFETVYRGTIEETVPQIEKEKLGEFVIIVS